MAVEGFSTTNSRCCPSLSRRALRAVGRLVGLGAKKDFALYPGQLEQPGAKKIAVGKLGDEASGVVMIRTGPATVRSYAIAWRQDNATAELEANGFKLTLPGVLALARKQDARLRTAAR